ncbi:MAG: 2'-5' RNA ligase superfamily protein [Chloroflexi bacterium]|nr:MAG: 2'-5' RNA ligase superfamily protein [Chloroflexota bacterium]
MATRSIALLFDDGTGGDIDLLRAVYDRDHVDRAPPHVPLVAPFDENTSSSDLLEMVGLIVAVHQPFMLELGAPEHFFDGEDQLLQFIATKGADESQRLAEALYRDVFPHHRPEDPERTPLQRSALTVGRFPAERDAVSAAKQLREKSYFCVITQVGMLEADDDGGWSILHAAELGSMISTD